MLGERLVIYWHALLIGLSGRLRFPMQAVHLKECRRAVELSYHVFGGDLKRSIIADAAGQPRIKYTTHAAMDLMAWLDREQIHLPGSINRYGDTILNRELYFWLAAFLALDRPLDLKLRMPAGIRHLLQGMVTSSCVLRQFPGLASRYQRLCAAELTQRETALPKLGMQPSPVHQLEAAIRFSLGSERLPQDDWLREAVERAREGVLVPLPSHWREGFIPFLPVPLWGRPLGEMPGLRMRWLKRRMHRSADGRQKSMSRPAFEPGKQPHSKSAAAVQGKHLYKEWDCRQRAYRSDWSRVIESTPPETTAKYQTIETEDRLLAGQVRRQFEALRQVSGWKRNLETGQDVDVDAFVDAYADKRGIGFHDVGLYRSRMPRWRDLSVAVLLDVSRSTQAWVGDRRVIDIARRSLLVLAEAFTAVGDEFAIYGFSSDSRLRVRCYRIKAFDDRYSQQTRLRLTALMPADYTRMGAAVRHMGNKLQQRSCRQKILLILTDGRPHDPTDRYEGQYAVEDTRQALRELRVTGIHCFGLTIDQYGRDYLPHLFGAGHFAVFSRPQLLPQVLPRLYARITSLAA